MKRKLIICVLALGLLTGCGTAKLKNGEEVFVEFKDKSAISVDDIWKDVKKDYALMITLNKIDSKILNEEYKGKKKDLEEYISNYETYFKANYVDEKGNYDEKTALQTLSQYGYNSLEDLLEDQKINYLRNLAVTDYAKSKVTDKEVKDYYKNEAAGDIHCVHILVKPEGTDNASDEAAKKKANEIITSIKNDIKSGTKAEDAFKKYENNDSVTYQDLNYFNKGDMVEEFETAAYKLKKGSYTTSPVKTSFGYHVILKLDEKEKESLEKLQDSIKEKLAEKAVTEDSKMEVNAMLELRKKYGVKFKDSETEEQYNRYINNLLNQAN